MGEGSLRGKVESLVGLGADDFEISKEFKNHIKTYLSSLNEIFEADFGREFLYRHTRELDSILIEMFRYILRDSFGDYQPLINSIPISLIALGSYGRQQLAVYSDIDIMLLYKEVKGYAIKPILERFLYLAWDSGLKIGHRVHEVSEIPEAVKADITIKTAILESRFIWGSKFLWMEYQNKLSQVRRTNRKEFVFAKLEEMQKRHKKYKLSMEPNIKEGRGGLRDPNTLFWLSTYIYGVGSNKELMGKLFTELEYKEYRIALEFLFKLRNALHLLSGKKQDEMPIQIQREIALKLGFRDMKTHKAERALMAKTLRSMQAINIFSSINSSKLVRKIVFGEKPLCEIRNARVKKKFYIVDGVLYTTFRNKARSLADATLALVGIGANNFDYSIHQFIINSAAQKKQKKITKELIISVLSADSSYKTLYLLYEAGVLQRFFPPFEKIMFLAQFDGYHAYPVDIHTLETIKHLENIQDNFVKSVFDSFDIEEKVYLKLAALFHDIGKGRGGNHSVVGARIFASFAKKMGLDEQNSEIVRRVILYHTLMSNTAFREDLNSEKTILSFAANLKSKKAIDYLFVLTYADLQAVGQNIYSSFNATLLRELYHKSTRKLSQPKLVSEAATRLTKEAILLKSEEFKGLPHALQKKIISIASNLFFIKFSSSIVIDICKRVKEVREGEFCFFIGNDPYFSFEIISKRWINFGRLLSRFAFLDIVSMDIFKLFDGAKYFKVSFSSVVDEQELYMARDILNSFALRGEKGSVTKKPIIKKSDISFDFEHSETYAKMLLTTTNQQGLLAFVIEVFDELEIDIATAKVGTIKNVAKDLFLIEKSSGIEKKQKEVVKRLISGGA